MREISQANDEIIIKGNSFFIGLGVVGGIMSFVGFKLIFGLVPFDEGYTGADIFGFIFACVWTALVSCVSVYGFVISAKKIIINADGVCSVSYLGKKFISWADIKDFGLSYCGQTRGEGNTYYLYFSERECAVKNECTKKLKGKMIKMFVMESDYSDVVNKIIPFCKDKTQIGAFIGKDKYHFM